MPAPPAPTDPDGGPGDSGRKSLLAEGTAAGLMFLTAPAAGYFLGKWISQALHLPAALAWIGAALGLAAAFVHLVRLSARVSR